MKEDRIGLPYFESETDRPKRIRTENPLLSHLDWDSIAQERFNEIVNKLSETEGGFPVSMQSVITVRNNGPYPDKYLVASIPYDGNLEKVKESLRQFAHETFVTRTLNEQTFTIKGRFGSKGKPEHSINRGSEKYENSNHVNGFLIRDDHIDVGYDLSEPISELQYAYELLITSLIAAGSIDISTYEKREASLATRRDAFMKLYHTMLPEYVPLAQLEDIFGVDSQIDEINTNLYNPLITNQGHPMNVLLVGAPGVGKSLVSRYFLGNKDVLTVSTDIHSLQEGYLEHSLLPSLNRIKYSLNLPTVIHIDDIEIILESGMNVDEEGRITHSIDPEERSRALTLLERLDDTHEIPILGTLNHPDIEAAFLRRFHPVYFPLPSQEIRKRMISEILSQDIPENLRSTTIDRLSQDTEGFNFNSIALIPRYMRNVMANNTDWAPEEYNKALKQACNWARARAGINKIAKIDKTAREMVGL